MDDQRFDDLTKALATATSRRGVLRGLAGGAAGLLALLGAGDASAKPKPVKPDKKCVPATCQPGQCGLVANGCGGTMDCGECCTPVTTCQPGQCGTVGDGCGGILDCGTCCIPDSPETTCNGKCGTVLNNCKQEVFCGFSNCGSSGCFVAGTLISMADGTSKPIETVVAGDDVLGRGGRATRVLGVLRPVLGDRPLYALNGGPFFVTASHPFLTEDGWKAVDPDAARAEVPGLEIGPLTVGDVLVAVEAGSNERPVRLRSLEGRPADPATQLYNLDVGGADTYVAAGLVVHNKAAF